MSSLVMQRGYFCIVIIFYNGPLYTGTIYSSPFTGSPVKLTKDNLYEIGDFIAEPSL